MGPGRGSRPVWKLRLASGHIIQVSYRDTSPPPISPPPTGCGTAGVLLFHRLSAHNLGGRDFCVSVPRRRKGHTSFQRVSVITFPSSCGQLFSTFITMQWVLIMFSDQRAKQLLPCVLLVLAISPSILHLCGKVPSVKAVLRHAPKGSSLI